MRSGIRIVIFLLALPSVNLVTAAQNQPLKFEVASVKPANARSGIDMRTFQGGRLLATNCTLKQLIMGAYALKEPFQVVGGPTWVDVDRFEVEGKAAEDLTNDPDRVIALGREAPRKLTLMLQTLLQARFKLSVHRETRQNTVYRLVVAKNGLKLAQPEDRTQQPFVGFGRLDPVDRPATTLFISGKNAPMALLTQRLAGLLAHPVLDETGITGNFDFRFEYAADDTQPNSGPSIFTAIHELGLNVEAGTGPVEVVVIDHAERPDAN
jgi:uncharacterized protein (TIGR03435 family)